MRPVTLMAVVVGVSLLTYLPVFNAGFTNWDDREQITLNPDFNPPKLDRMISYIRGPYLGSLYPVAYWYLGGVSALAGPTVPDERGDRLRAWPFHVGNVVLHTAAALVVLALLQELQFSPFAAVAGALLFAVHPVQVDAVAWISGFNTVLSGLFVLLALLAYVRFARCGCLRWYLLATLLYGLALLSKPSAVVAPVMALLLDRGFIRSHRRWWSLGFWFLLAVPLMILTRRLQTASGVGPTPIWFRALVATDAIAFYLRQLVFPVRLLVDYGRSPARLLAGGMWKFTWIVPVILTVLVVIWRRKPMVWTAAGLFIAGILPVLGFTPFNGQTISTVSDRFLYLSMLGVAIAAAAGLNRLKSPAVWGAVTGLLLLFAGRSFARAMDWHDESKLFHVELLGNPFSIAANEVLGADAAAVGDEASAIQHYSMALAVNPADARIPFNLGNAYLRSGNAAQAVPFYQLAMEDQQRTSADQPMQADIPYNLGIAQMRCGNSAAAQQAFHKALEIQPDYPALRRMKAGTQP